MSELIDNPCPICGGPIPERPRGSRHGHPPKTCSKACRRERTRRKERDRYYKVKDTPRFHEVRSDYLAVLKKRFIAAPEYAAIFRARAALAMKRSNAKIDGEKPEVRLTRLAAKRAERAEWRKQLVSEPAAWEAHKAACRAWYASLSKAERDRIYYAPRRMIRNQSRR